MKKRLENFWYYNKVYVIIGLALLVVGLWFFLQRQPAESDYGIAIVSPQWLSEEQLGKIKTVLEQAGKDQNGDGTVKVDLRAFRFAIGEDNQDRIEISKLDADLVGKASGIFFTDDPESFEQVTNGIGKAADAVPVSSISALSGCGIDDLYLLPRADSELKYAELISALKETKN